MVIDMSRILVKEDVSGKEHFVEYWLSQKGNLCWRIGETLYVKMKSGFTMMLENPEQNKWIRSNAHTKAKIQSAEIPKAEFSKTKLTTRLVQ